MIAASFSAIVIINLNVADGRALEGIGLDVAPVGFR